MTDFSSLQTGFKSNKLTDRDIVAATAFFVVEQILVWLSSLEDKDRAIYIEGLNKSEKQLAYALINGFYLAVTEMDRRISTVDALKLLNSAWYTQSAVWMTKRWDALSAIIAAAASTFSKKEIGEGMDISAPAEALLKSLTGTSANTARAILAKLTELARAFGFSGVCVLVDKIDETASTANSAEATARLVHPLLSHIQLLEVEGFAWIMFIWNNVQGHFDSKIPVRLDKIAHANITWNNATLSEMVENRMKFFSNGRCDFSALFEPGLNTEKIFDGLVAMSVSSPRELIKLLDIIIREHDSRQGHHSPLIDQESLELGQDKYATETISTWFKVKPLQQVLRLGKASFVNRDVQTIFRITDQGARVRINGWEDAGLVRQSGTAPSELGGKPVNRYIIADARVERIVTRRLDSTVGTGAADGEDEQEDGENVAEQDRGGV